MAENSFIGEILSPRKAGYTRIARIVIFFTIFQAIITLSAVFAELGLAWYAAGCLAAAVGILFEPLMTVLLYTSYQEKFNTVKIFAGLVLAVVINVGACVGTWFFCDDSGESFHSDWMLAIAVGFGVFFLLGQQVCSIYKYVLYRMSQANF